MEKYLVPVESTPEKFPPIKRNRWKRSLIELNGRFESNYRHQYSGLIFESYSEVGLYPHKYHVDGEPCRTHVAWFTGSVLNNNSVAMSWQGVSSLEFDSKGVYLASVTKSGCLTVHDFDSVQSSDLQEDEAKQLLHISTGQQLDVIRWNLSNQDEVGCTSIKSSEVCIFDIGYISSEPVQVLKKKPSITVHGYNTLKGFRDIAFCSDDRSRLLASDNNGVINVWDRRAGNFPFMELSKSSAGSLNSIKLSADNEIVYGASSLGTIYMWDFRGGRSSSAFGNQKEGSLSPLIAVKLTNELEKISSLKISGKSSQVESIITRKAIGFELSYLQYAVQGLFAQSDIVTKEIHSIDIDPSCPYQLAFHLDDGWSGVLDTDRLQVTHIHCPPPPWLDECNGLANLSHLRKPCWLPMNSIYVVGSSSSNGLYLLDFFPHRSSPCHVDYNDDIRKIDDTHSQQRIKNRLLATTEGITACTAHPLSGTIVAGTTLSSVLLISQSMTSC